MSDPTNVTAGGNGRWNGPSARDDYPPARCKAPGVHMWDTQYEAMCDEIDRLRDQLARLVEEVDMVLEYNHPPRIMRLMLHVEELKPNHYGWGSWLAAEGYKMYPVEP